MFENSWGTVCFRSCELILDVGILFSIPLQSICVPYGLGVEPVHYVYDWT